MALMAIMAHTFPDAQGGRDAVDTPLKALRALKAQTITPPAHQLFTVENNKKHQILSNFTNSSAFNRSHPPTHRLEEFMTLWVPPISCLG